MHQESATLNPPVTATSRWVFARHFGEMVLAMFLGMAVLGGLAELSFAAAGSSLDDTAAELQVLLMGLNMTVPMVAWMRYRGHTDARNAEMAASMILPTLLAAALAWTGVLGTGGAMALQHGVMIPAMLGVMLWRYQEYSQSHS
jgi:hypothetical protein